MKRTPLISSRKSFNRRAPVQFILLSAAGLIGPGIAHATDISWNRAAGNSGNIGDGITISGDGALGTTIGGNTIGLDAAGDVALGNGGNGIRIDGAPLTTIGSAEAPNVIAGNLGDGVSIGGEGAYGTALAHNTRDAAAATTRIPPSSDRLG